MNQLFVVIETCYVQEGFLTHITHDAIESTQKQNIELTTKLAELVFYGFKEEYGDYSTI